jgi:type I restriction enzyme S subunit
MSRDREWIGIDPESAYRPIGVRGFGRGIIRYPATSVSGLSKMRYFVVVPGDLLIRNIKAWEGAVCVASGGDEGRVASNRFLQYRSKNDGVTTGWLEQYLVTDEGVALLGAASPGSADRNRTLSMEAFEAIEVPVPSRSVQDQVVSAVSCARRISEISARRDSLASALLPAARNEIFSSML